MSNLIFVFKAYNPNKRTTFFMHKKYTDYLAYSEYAIKNTNTNHGLFGKVKMFPNIKDLENINPIVEYVTELAKKKVPIYRGLISLNEYDALRLGYDKQEKWQELLEGKLVSIAKKMNIKYEDLQYAGAVHLEEGHPHLQFFIWSKQKEKMNYFISYSRINKLRDEFTNEVFREDLLPIYQEKDIAKKNILAENEILNKLKQISTNREFIKSIMKYEKNFHQNKIMKQTFKDEELKKIIELLLNLKEDLRTTEGSIKYEYLKRYPNIIKKVDDISREIINTSYECRVQIDNYIKAKQKILKFKYNNKEKLHIEEQKVKEETEQEVLKLIGNKILDFERNLLNEKEEYNKYKYVNRTRDNISYIYNLFCTLSYKEECKYKIFESKYKKHLSKQAKKEKAIQKANSSSFNWEEQI